MGWTSAAVFTHYRGRNIFSLELTLIPLLMVRTTDEITNFPIYYNTYSSFYKIIDCDQNLLTIIDFLQLIFVCVWSFIIYLYLYTIITNRHCSWSNNNIYSGTFFKINFVYTWKTFPLFTSLIMASNTQHFSKYQLIKYTLVSLMYFFPLSIAYHCKKHLVKNEYISAF